MTEYMCYAELAVGLGGFAFGIWSEMKRKSDETKRKTERQWIHVALVNLKPSIEGPNASKILGAINNMLEFLQPPK
jgi:hypothetical protein